MTSSEQIDLLLERAADEAQYAEGDGFYASYYNGFAHGYYNAAWLIAGQLDWPHFDSWKRYLRDARMGKDGSQ